MDRAVGTPSPYPHAGPSTSDPADDIRSEKDYEGGVRQWYNNTFYVWGYQTIRNVTKDDRVRDVFYINKVVVY